MRSIILASTFLLIASGVLLTIGSKHKGEAAPVAAQAQTQPQPTPTDGVRRVTVEELRAALNNGTAIVIDVRSKEQYNAGHIKGAQWIMADEIAGHIKELPKNKLVVTYCS